MKTKMTIFLGVLPLLSGCICVCGTDTYYLHGRLQNAQDGKPVVGVNVVGSYFADHPPMEESWNKSVSITDADGSFNTQAFHLWLGHCIIPIDVCFPDPLEEATLFVGKDDKWQRITIKLRPSQQSRVAADAKRWVELGDVRYDPNGTIVTTRPAE